MAAIRATSMEEKIEALERIGCTCAAIFNQRQGTAPTDCLEELRLACRAAVSHLKNLPADQRAYYYATIEKSKPYAFAIWQYFVNNQDFFKSASKAMQWRADLFPANLPDPSPPTEPKEVATPEKSSVDGNFELGPGSVVGEATPGTEQRRVIPLDAQNVQKLAHKPARGLAIPGQRIDNGFLGHAQGDHAANSGKLSPFPRESESEKSQDNNKHLGKDVLPMDSLTKNFRAQTPLPSLQADSLSLKRKAQYEADDPPPSARPRNTDVSEQPFQKASSFIPMTVSRTSSFIPEHIGLSPNSVTNRPSMSSNVQIENHRLASPTVSQLPRPVEEDTAILGSVTIIPPTTMLDLQVESRRSRPPELSAINAQTEVSQTQTEQRTLTIPSNLQTYPLVDEDWAASQVTATTFASTLGDGADVSAPAADGNKEVSRSQVKPARSSNTRTEPTFDEGGRVPQSALTGLVPCSGNCIEAQVPPPSSDMEIDFVFDESATVPPSTMAGQESSPSNVMVAPNPSLLNLHIDPAVDEGESTSQGTAVGLVLSSGSRVDSPVPPPSDDMRIDPAVDEGERAPQPPATRLVPSPSNDMSVSNQSSLCDMQVDPAVGEDERASQAPVVVLVPSSGTRSTSPRSPSSFDMQVDPAVDKGGSTSQATAIGMVPSSGSNVGAPVPPPSADMQVDQAIGEGGRASQATVTGLVPSASIHIDAPAPRPTSPDAQVEPQIHPVLSISQTDPAISYSKETTHATTIALLPNLANGKETHALPSTQLDIQPEIQHPPTLYDILAKPDRTVNTPFSRPPVEGKIEVCGTTILPSEVAKSQSEPVPVSKQKPVTCWIPVDELAPGGACTRCKERGEECKISYDLVLTPSGYTRKITRGTCSGCGTAHIKCDWRPEFRPCPKKGHNHISLDDSPAAKIWCEAPAARDEEQQCKFSNCPSSNPINGQAGTDWQLHGTHAGEKLTKKRRRTPKPTQRGDTPRSRDAFLVFSPRSEEAGDITQRYRTATVEIYAEQSPPTASIHIERALAVNVESPVIVNDATSGGSGGSQSTFGDTRQQTPGSADWGELQTRRIPFREYEQGRRNDADKPLDRSVEVGQEEQPLDLNLDKRSTAPASLPPREDACSGILQPDPLSSDAIAPTLEQHSSLTVPAFASADRHIPASGSNAFDRHSISKSGGFFLPVKSCERSCCKLRLSHLETIFPPAGNEHELNVIEGVLRGPQDSGTMARTCNASQPDEPNVEATIAQLCAQIIQDASAVLREAYRSTFGLEGKEIDPLVLAFSVGFERKIHHLLPRVLEQSAYRKPSEGPVHYCPSNESALENLSKQCRDLFNTTKSSYEKILMQMDESQMVISKQARDMNDTTLQVVRFLAQMVIGLYEISDDGISRKTAKDRSVLPAMAELLRKFELSFTKAGECHDPLPTRINNETALQGQAEGSMQTK